MAAFGDYRFRLPGGVGREPTVAINGFVHFDVYIERCTGTDTEEIWEQIPMGHLTIPVAGVLLEQCATAGDALALLEQEIIGRGLAQAHRARQAVIDLLPSGQWPENDITQVISLP